MFRSVVISTALHLCSFLFLIHGNGVFAQTSPLVAFNRPDWPSQGSCVDLQLNVTAQTMLQGNTLYILANINGPGVGYANVSSSASYNIAIEALVGIVDMSTSFTVSNYNIEWYTCAYFSYQWSFVAPGANNQVIFFGDERSQYGVANTTQSLIELDPSALTLSYVNWPSSLPQDKLPTYGASIPVPEREVAYYSGVFPNDLQGSYNAQLFIYNATTGQFSIQASPNDLWSAGVYLPLGVEGILVMLGGKERDDFTKALDMSSVQIYDIHTNSWFLQPTTGTAPLGRQNICVVAAIAQDGSSYQIHLYGGDRITDSSSNLVPLVDNHYILSIPTFTWIKAPNLANPRTWASCDLIGSHKMLITAGYLAPNSGCVQLLDVIDLNTLAETTSLSEDGDYLVPELVYNVIGGGPTGGANQSSSTGSFIDGLQNILSATYMYATATPSHTNSTNSAAPKSSAPIGAIVGGTVGGVAVGALLIGGIIFLLRRRRNSNPSDPANFPPSNFPPTAGGDANIEGGVYDPEKNRGSIATGPPMYASQPGSPVNAGFQGYNQYAPFNGYDMQQDPQGVVEISGEPSANPPGRIASPPLAGTGALPPSHEVEGSTFVHELPDSGMERPNPGY